MLFGKKKRTDISPADVERARLEHKCRTAAYHLKECVQNAVICTKAIDLYPYGKERDEAIDDCMKAKFSVKCAIETFDSVREELSSYVRDHQSEFVAMVHDIDPYNLEYTSHRCVESALRDIYCGRWRNTCVVEED